jgi:hypothetical protein
MDSEEQGNTNDQIFESLKSIRMKRIRDTESPKFQTVSSKQSSNNMSFGGQRNSLNPKANLKALGKGPIFTFI